MLNKTTLDVGGVPLDLADLDAVRNFDYDIDTIARALSRICRYNGRGSKFYSVAEHSMLVANHVYPDNELAALLHDASEAYLGDIVEPVKQFMGPYYRELEDTMSAAIYRQFGTTYRPEVDKIDKAILVDEREYFFEDTKLDWGLGRGLGITYFECLNPIEAKARFLLKFRKIVYNNGGGGKAHRGID